MVRLLELPWLFGATFQASPPADILPWVLAGISTVVASLSTALVAVYHGRISDLKERIARQDKQIDELLADVAPRVRQIEERQSRR